MTAHARLKNEFTEDEKYHNLMKWLISVLNAGTSATEAYEPHHEKTCLRGLRLVNPSHAVRDLSRVRQYPPWLLFTVFVDSVGYPRYNLQKTRKQ